MGEGEGRRQLGQLTPTGQRDIAYHMTTPCIMLSNKGQGRKKERGSSSDFLLCPAMSTGVGVRQLDNVNPAPYHFVLCLPMSL